MARVPFGFRIVGLRSKYRFALLVFVVNEAFFGFLSLYVSQLFLIGVIGILVVFGIFAITLKCPVCGKPVLYNRVNNLGIDMYAYTLTIPRNCTQCGTKLE
jgi:hypothetical protein